MIAVIINTCDLSDDAMTNYVNLVELFGFTPTVVEKNPSVTDMIKQAFVHASNIDDYVMFFDTETLPLSRTFYENLKTISHFLNVSTVMFSFFNTMDIPMPFGFSGTIMHGLVAKYFLTCPELRKWEDDPDEKILEEVFVRYVYDGSTMIPLYLKFDKQFYFIPPPVGPHSFTAASKVLFNNRYICSSTVNIEDVLASDIFINTARTIMG